MKKMILCCSLFLSLGALAKEDKFNLGKMKARFEVKGEVYYMNAKTGGEVEKNHQSRLWKTRGDGGKSEIDHQWSAGSEQMGDFAIKHVWTVQDDGSVKVKIEEYAQVVDGKNDKGERETQFKELLKSEERVLENFEPLSWVSVRPNKLGKKIVVRFTPQLGDEEPIQKLGELPISGVDLVLTDNEGRMWMNNNTLSGKYVGLTTYYGSLFLSFYPFKGAKELGFAEGNKIELNLGEKKVATLLSQTAFLPQDVRAIVYGIHRPLQKTARLSSIHSRSSNKEDRFLKSIDEKEVH